MEQETRGEPAKDLYAGYYWGNDPHDSYEMPGRKSDHKLKNSILEHLRQDKKIGLDSIIILVNNGTVILTGHVRGYQNRRLISYVLNELQVTESETAGPGKISEEVE